MTTTVEPCADVDLRLIEGLRPADDPVLAAHLRSCLRCFRTATELRDVPQIAALLEQGRELEQPDPGEQFWAGFPRSVADAWERRQAPAPAKVRESESAWRRMARWFQLPIPAALSGATVAAALVLAVVHRSPPPAAVGLVSVAPAPAAAPAVTAAELALDDEPTGVLGEEDPLDSLELADATSVAHLDREARTPATDESAEPGPSPVEEVELLETDDLRAVAQAMRGRGKI